MTGWKYVTVLILLAVVKSMLLGVSVIFHLRFIKLFALNIFMLDDASTRAC